MSMPTRRLARSGRSARSDGLSLSVQHGGPDGDIADLDVVELLDREATALALFPNAWIVQLTKELGTDETEVVRSTPSVNSRRNASSSVRTAFLEPACTACVRPILSFDVDTMVTRCPRP